MRIAIVGTGVSGLVCGPPAAPAPRHHRVRVRRANRRSRQHRRRRGRRPVARGRHRIHRLQRAQLSRVRRHCSSELGVATQPTRDELQRQRRRAPGSSSGARTSTRSSPSAATCATRLPAAAGRHRPLQPRPAGSSRTSARGRAGPAPGGGGRDARRGVAGRVRASRPVLADRSCGSSSSRSARRSGRPIRRRFMRFPVRAYARFMDNHGLLEHAGRPAVAHRHRRLRAATSRRSPRRSPIAYELDSRCTRSSTRTTAGGVARVELLTERGPEIVRPCDRGDAQRSGAAHARRCDARRARDPRRDRVSAQHRDVAHRRADAARATRGPGRAGTTPSTRTTARATRHLLDEPAAVDRELGDRCSSPSTAATTIDPTRRVLAEFEYDHPVFDVAAMAAQRRRAEIQGRRGIYFAGAYWGYGFHEDGVQSALEVVAAIEGRPMTALAAPSRDRSPTRTCRRDRPRRRDLRGDGRGIAGSLPVRRVHAEAVPRLPRRRRAPGLARPAAALVGAPAGARPVPPARLPRRRRPAARRRRARPGAADGSAAGPTGPCPLLAQLRTFGWLFNPLAVYYCWTRERTGARRDACSR